MGSLVNQLETNSGIHTKIQTQYQALELDKQEKEQETENHWKRAQAQLPSELVKSKTIHLKSKSKRRTQRTQTLQAKILTK